MCLRRSGDLLSWGGWVKKTAGATKPDSKQVATVSARKQGGAAEPHEKNGGPRRHPERASKGDGRRLAVWGGEGVDLRTPRTALDRRKL